MDYIAYTTKEGDRWDSIAYLQYGAMKLTVVDEFGNNVEVDAIDLIIQANSAVPIEAEMAAGILLRIPMVDYVDTQKELLPPWKR